MIRLFHNGVSVIWQGVFSNKRSGLETPVWLTLRIKFILVASLLVVFALQFNTLFNRSSLEKLYLESRIAHLRIQSHQILSAYDEIGEQYQTAGQARIQAALIEARQRLLSQIGISGQASKASQNLKLSIIPPTGRIFACSDVSGNMAMIPLPLLNHFKNILDGTKRQVSGSYFLDGDSIFIGQAIDRNGVGSKGLFLISTDKPTLIGPVRSRIQYPKEVIWVVALATIGILILILRHLIPNQSESAGMRDKKCNAVVIIVCCLSQLICSSIFIFSYHRQLLDLKQEELKSSLGRLLKDTTQIVNLDREEMAAALKEKVDLAMQFDEVLGRVEFWMNNGFDANHQRVTAKADQSWFHFALLTIFDIPQMGSKGAFQDLNGNSGTLAINSSAVHITSVLMKVILDVVTVFVISVLFFVEMLFFIGMVLRSKKSNEPQAVHIDFRLMRPAAFLLFFAVDLTMSFIPLHLSKLYEPMLGLSKDLILGLPITVEFIFVGLTIFLAGFWVDRRGWHEPFLIGMSLTAGGILYSWLAPNAMHFIVSRAFVGSGYGFALMASQCFVIQFTDSKSKASGLADLFAGIYAGSICGGATGAMLADRYGYHIVFLIGAIVIIGVIFYCFIFMKEAMVNPIKTGDKRASTEDQPNVGFWGFLKNRIVIALIFFSSLPAAIAVVGFLNFFSPLYLNHLGVSQSAIGRILMIYGISLVYIGPIIGRYVDLSENKKGYVFVGCLLGSATFLMFLFAKGILAATIGAFILSLSSSFVLSSQSAYILHLKITRAYGAGKAMGIFRSSSRIGQALGPIVFSHLMKFGDLERSIKFFGFAYLATALIFLMLTQKDRSHTL